MTCSSTGLSEEQLECSVCLDVFTDPVSTPCGHNFCQTCINTHWDNHQVYRCPLCKKTFDDRPELCVNTAFRNVVDQFKRSRVPGGGQAVEVLCDFCRKLSAVKSCLDCVASYCEEHLEPHKKVTSLKRHQLIEPVENLEERVCEKHRRPLEMFCRTDQECVCLTCRDLDHKDHDTVTLETESEERTKSAAMDIEDGRQVRTLLLQSLEKVQISTKTSTEEIKQGIADLQMRNTELEQLCLTGDHLCLIKILPKKRINSDAGVGRKTLTGLRKTIDMEIQKMTATELRIIQKDAVNVTLDPDTAGVFLVLSEDGKLVKRGVTGQDLPDNPKRFDASCVLGQEGFSSGRFYYEVQVKENTGWALGVARESVNRKGQITLSPVNGFWTVWLRDGEYRALAGPRMRLSLSPPPQKVGVFVDYERGQVSFYDVDNRSHIYSFTGQTFTETLYPFFSPRANTDGKNSAPLVITPVNHPE